mmetsp:Transcript_93234/g.267368  ORF Transcript_93234/g.267368 Transcript_93234/m.267368 type:complete len:403 (+) Transcript_93234:22-1230(+)
MQRLIREGARAMADDPVTMLAREFAPKCLPALAAQGVSNLKAVTSASGKKIAGVWTGAGCVVEVKVKGDGDEACYFVAKKIGSYREVRRESGLVDHMSYYNELMFYETDLADKMCDAGALCPRPLFVARQSSGLADNSGRVAGPQTSARLQRALTRYRVKEDGGEEKDEGVICMTKLPGGRWGESQDHIQGALTWLARLHALFWGARADEVVATGVSDQAGFWHLDTRYLELANMSQTSPLRLAAAGLDARLKSDAMQTMCHGDPKGANIMADQKAGVSMYDFQWFGKAPPVKDLAYFFATAVFLCRDWKQSDEEAFLRYYHGELCQLLEAQGDDKPTFEYLYTSYQLAVCDYHRWIEGGFCWGDMNLIGFHTEACFRRIHEGKEPKTEEEYRAKIFECFPP